MQKNTRKLENERIYHIFIHSIDGENIFKKESDYTQFLRRMLYFNSSQNSRVFNPFPLLNIKEYAKICNKGENLVDIICYCFLPTHIHFIFKQKQNNGISIFINKLLKSYTKQINLKYKRNGLLFNKKFNSISIITTEQLIHTVGYVHVNPVCCSLVNKPEEWKHSSLGEYLKENTLFNICSISKEINFCDYHKNMVRNLVFTYKKEKRKKTKRNETIFSL